MTDYHDRRSTDPLLAQLSQKFDDHIEQNARDFNEIKDQLKPIVEVYQGAKWPMKIAKACFYLILGGALAKIGGWILCSISNHLK